MEEISLSYLLDLMAYLLIGIIVIIRLDMKYTRLPFKQWRGMPSECSYFFRTSSRSMIVIVVWPLTWLMFRKGPPSDFESDCSDWRS